MNHNTTQNAIKLLGSRKKTRGRQLCWIIKGKIKFVRTKSTTMKKRLRADDKKLLYTNRSSYNRLTPWVSAKWRCSVWASTKAGRIIRDHLGGPSLCHYERLRLHSGRGQQGLQGETACPGPWGCWRQEQTLFIVGDWINLEETKQRFEIESRPGEKAERMKENRW